MKLDKQCCSIGQAKILKQLGVVQESLFYHTNSEEWGILPKKSIDFTGNPISAFTCSELIQMNNGVDGIHFLQSGFASAEYAFVKYKRVPDAYAAKLIDAIKKGHVNIEEVNSRLLAE